MDPKDNGSSRPKRQRAAAAQTPRRVKKGKPGESTTSLVSAPARVGPAQPIDGHTRRFDYEAQIADYKIWRKQGSWHDPVCLECRKPDSLIPCQTCKRVYHAGCMPTAPSRTLNISDFNCIVCIELGWDSNPPLISPPLSPTVPVLPPPMSDYLRLQTPKETNSAAPTSQNTLPVNPSLPATNSSNGPSDTASISPSSQKNTQILSSRASQPDPEALEGFGTTRAYSQRRSRFATLPPNIDGALSLLYKELEASAFLRQKVSDLEQDARTLKQAVQIQSNEIQLLKAQKPAEKISDQELQELRRKAAAAETATSELAEAKSRNTALEAQVAEAAKELESKDEALNLWRGKLKELLKE